MSRQTHWIAALLLSLSAASATVGVPGVAAAQDATVDVEWRVMPDQVATLEKKARVRRVETYDQRDPVLVGTIVMIGSSAVPRLAKSIIDTYRRYKSGGVVIDAQRRPITVSTNPRVAAGYALVISKSGARTIALKGANPGDVDDLSAILASATEAR